MTAVEVRELGKRYRLGEDLVRYATLRDTLASRIGRRREGPARTRDFWALRDVSFDVAEGEAVGVIGRNGAGKSTMLKLLARITEPTEGFARMRGRPGALLEVGTGFHPELTGRENVFLNGSILGMTRREIAARFDEIVEFAGVRPFLDTPLKRYSSGMELRLAFAVAAHVAPRILIVDEVLAVGDAEFQQRCLGKMSEIGRSGRTIVFVSHDLGAVQQLCPRTIWLDEGRIRADGPSGDVIAAYLRSGLAGATHVEFAPEEDEPVSLTSVSVLDGAGRPLELVRRGDTFTVRLRMRSRTALPNLDVAIYLADRRGIQVLDEAWSDTGRPPATSAGPGDYEIDLTMAPGLAPGPYTLGVWIGSAIAEGEDHVSRDAMTLTIAPAAGDRQDAVQRSRIVAPAVEWDMRPVAGGAAVSAK
jgi:ABC-type polysaccharide/polyol phosphate transport system ATPase subunit